MIKYFRKIRQKLLTENKFNKYLLYAIGEIILVVFGILIALQLNNLQEIKKNKGYEKEYLTRIKSDINEDIEELEEHFRTDTFKLDSYTFLTRYIQSKDFKTSPKEITDRAFAVGTLNWFEGNNIVFDEMKSSGKTSLIKSDSLRVKIQKYYRLFDEVIKQENLHNSSIINHSQRTFDMIKISPFLEMTMPERWNANSTMPTYQDVRLLFDNLSEKQKLLFAENYSAIKLQIINNHAIRLELYKEAILLPKIIDEHLN